MNVVFDTITKPWFSDTDRLENYNSDNWKYISANKRRTDGEFDGRTHRYTLNERTREMWVPDSVSTVAFKCGLLTVGNPLYMAATMVYHAIKIPVDIIRVIGQLAVGILFAMEFRETFPRELSKTIEKNFVDVVSSIVKDIWNIIRAPWFALGFEIAAIEGVVSDPFRARVKIGDIERNWNHGITRHNSCAVQCARMPLAPNVTYEDYQVCWQNTHTYYLAICMQKQGLIDELGVDSQNQPTNLSRWRISEMCDTYEAANGNSESSFLRLMGSIKDFVCPLNAVCYN